MRIVDNIDLVISCARKNRSASIDSEFADMFRDYQLDLLNLHLDTFDIELGDY